MTNEAFNTIATVSSLSIACCAFIVSWWQLSAQRRHNRLSVTPKLTATVVKMNGANEEWDFTNCGVGPAVIKEFSVYIGRDKLTFPSYTVLDSALTAIGCGAYESSHTMTVGDFIQVNEKTILLKFRREDAQKVKESVKKIKWEIVYESIYGVTDILKISADEES